MISVPRPIVWIGQSVFIALVLWLALGGTARDLRAPLIFSGDSLLTLAQARSIIDRDAWRPSPDLDRGVDADPLFRPRNNRVDQALMRIADVFSGRVATVVNMAWVFMVVIAGAASAWCLLRLGVSQSGAWCAGVLFALCPFALSRNTAEFSLMPYLVPFPATAALLLASGRWADEKRRGLVIGNLILGFNALYYAIFGAFFVAVGAVAGYIRGRQRGLLTAGVVSLAAIALATMVNVAPDAVTRSRDDRPNIAGPQTADAEAQGLKIRHLVSPLPNHWFRPFRHWNRRDEGAGFPQDTQRSGSHLGLVATAGFLGLIVVLFIPSAAGTTTAAETIHSASRLTLAAILLATVGGLGSAFNALISPDLTTYSRITPFIAFFALVALALWIDHLTSARHRWRGAVWTALLVIGLFDQFVVLKPVNARRELVEAEFSELRRFVGALEETLPDDAMILQLPIRPFPPDEGTARARAYEHFKPWLVSDTLRWSYPAVSDTQMRQQADIAALEPRDLPVYLTREGFSVIVVDREGYNDNGDAILGALQNSLPTVKPIAHTERYVALTIRNP